MVGSWPNQQFGVPMPRLLYPPKGECEWGFSLPFLYWKDPLYVLQERGLACRADWF